MKNKILVSIISVLMIAMMFGGTGCKSYNRTRTVWFGDHNVTVVKKPRRHKVAGRKKIVTSRTHNHANRMPGR